VADQFGEKIHDPTEYRLSEARKKGNVAKSQDLGAALLLVIATGILLFAGEYAFNELPPYFVEHLGGQAWVATDKDEVLNHWARMQWVLAWSTIPLLTLLVVAAIISQVAQTGVMFVPDKLLPDLERINPLKGLSRLFSTQSLARLGFGVFKILVVVVVASVALWLRAEDFLQMVSWSVGQITAYTLQTVLWITFQVAVALLILAFLDYAYQSWSWNEGLKMTEQEFREEMKQLIGDPQILRRRKQVQMQMARSRVASAVTNADAVITNPTELAVAIKYDPTKMQAPVVIAKGAGTMAQRIRRIALEHHIPIIERKELAQALYRDVDINQEVPLDQYNAVAEVLRYVYQLQGKSLPSMPQKAA
jgi:flagellar biosynthetic protein FlhB